MTKLESNLNKLPDYCLVLKSKVNPDQQGIIQIRKGEQGYYIWHRCEQGMTEAEEVEKINAQQRVTPAQVEAMLVGSMFGWQVPGADPDKYDSRVNAWSV